MNVWETAQPDQCPSCNGTGYMPDNSTCGKTTCMRCMGSGVLYRITYTATPAQTVRSPCEMIDDLRDEIRRLKARVDVLEARKSASPDADTGA